MRGLQGFFCFLALAVAPAAFAQPAPQSSMTLHVIDVDQGNAALVEFSCGAVLIDAGGRTEASDDRLIAYLDTFFARRADLNRRIAAVFVTHPHKDHNRALRRVAERYAVGGYVDNGLTTGSGRANARWMTRHVADAGIPHRVVASGLLYGRGGRGYSDEIIDPLACADGDPQIRVLAGARGRGAWSRSAYENLNNHSVIIRIDLGEASVLFPGDAESEQNAALVARYRQSGLLDADVLMVNHHGAENGTSTAYLRQVTPQIAILSTGPERVHESWTAWAYGHPRARTVTLLAAAIETPRDVPEDEPVGLGAERFERRRIDRAIYATGWDGDILLTGRGDGVWSVTRP